MWGYVEKIVYLQKIRDLNHLLEQIIKAMATITPDLIQCTWLETEYHYDVCRVTSGAHTETF